MAIAKHSFPLGGFQDARKPANPAVVLTTLSIFFALVERRARAVETLTILGAMLNAQVAK